LGGKRQLPLFRVQGPDGNDRFVDDTGRTYNSMQQWKQNNKLPAGQVTYFADGHMSSTPDGKPKTVTEDTHAVLDTFWEKAKPWVDGAVTAVGVVATGAAIIGTGGAALPLILGGVAAYGAANAGSTLIDRASHGESLNPLQDADARNAWIDLTTNAVGVAAIGSSIRAARGIKGVMDASGKVAGTSDDVFRALQMQRFAQGVNTASMAGDAVGIGNQTYNLATQWEKLSPEQRMLTMGQIAFWGGMAAQGARSNQQGAYGTEELTNYLEGYRSLQEGRSAQFKEDSVQRTPVAPDSPLQQMAAIRKRWQAGAITEAEAIQQLKQVQPSAGKPTPVAPTPEQQKLQTPGESGKSSPKALTPEQQKLQAQGEQLSQALPKRQQVPVTVDPELNGNTVRVHYSVDQQGQITDIHIKAGPEATAQDVQLHAQTVKRMQQYSGLSRHVQRMKDHLRGWISKNGAPPVGSKAWEAQLEIEKLPQIIQERANRLASGGLDEKTQGRLEAELADLKQQVVQHQKRDPGKGFVAAESEIPWKASMSQAEAELYTQDSYYKGKMFYHGTNVRSAQNIAEQGLDPGKFDEFSTYGPGFYVGNDQSIARNYAQRKKEETGQDSAVLGMMLDARKPKVFASGTAYQEAVTSYIKQSGKTDEEWTVAYTNYLRSEGYDAVEITGIGYTTVFEKEQVVVTSNEIVK
jgi:hypothetical protein